MLEKPEKARKRGYVLTKSSNVTHLNIAQGSSSLGLRSQHSTILSTITHDDGKGFAFSCYLR